MADTWRERNVGGLFAWAATRVGGDGATIRARTLDELREYEARADGVDLGAAFEAAEEEERVLSHEMVAAECYDGCVGDEHYCDDYEVPPGWAVDAWHEAHRRGHV